MDLVRSIRPAKTTFAEMKASSVRDVLICCSDYHCSHHTRSVAIGDPTMFACLISSLKFDCSACGERVADMRPNWD